MFVADIMEKRSELLVVIVVFIQVRLLEQIEIWCGSNLLEILADMAMVLEAMVETEDLDMELHLAQLPG